MDTTYIKSDGSTTDKLEIRIAELYLFLLPVRQMTQLSFLRDIVGASATWLPSVFHAIGLLLWIINSSGRFDIVEEKRGLVRHALALVVYLNLSSVVMAVVMQLTYGNHGVENAFQGIIGMELYFFQYFLMFLYNYHVFQIIPLNRIKKILLTCIRALLVLGYVQILVMNGIGGQIYDRLNIFGVLNSSHKLPKLCLTGSEGASAGGMIAIFIFPLLYSQIIKGDRKFIIELLLWLLPLYYTNSSTAYILATICTGMFILLSIANSDNPTGGFLTVIIIVLVIAILFFALTRTGILDDEMIEHIRYLLLDKATDRENGSTVSRTIPFLVNWGAFTEYPLLGVGNGLQGYFYEKYFPDWALQVRGSDVGEFLERSRGGISNGGVFFPSLLSGYGIIGCLAILIFIWRCFQELQRVKPYIDIFYYSCLLSFASFAVMGFQGDVYGMYYVWFMVSMPFICGVKPDLDTEITLPRSKYIRY